MYAQRLNILIENEFNDFVKALSDAFESAFFSLISYFSEHAFSYFSEYTSRPFCSPTLMISVAEEPYGIFLMAGSHYALIQN